MAQKGSLSVMKRKAITLIKKLGTARAEISKLDLELKRLKIGKGNIELELFDVLEALRDNGIPSLAVEGVGTVSTRTTVFGDVPKDKIGDAEQLFEELGIEEFMFERKIVKRRLNEWVREQVERGKALPECVKAVYKRSISIRNKKENGNGN